MFLALISNRTMSKNTEKDFSRQPSKPSFIKLMKIIPNYNVTIRIRIRSPSNETEKYYIRKIILSKDTRHLFCTSSPSIETIRAEKASADLI